MAAACSKRLAWEWRILFEVYPSGQLTLFKIAPDDSVALPTTQTHVPWVQDFDLRQVYLLKTPEVFLTGSRLPAEVECWMREIILAGA